MTLEFDCAWIPAGGNHTKGAHSMWRRSATIAAVYSGVWIGGTLTMPLSASAAWLTSDNRVIEDAGVWVAVGDFCQVDTTDLLDEAALYIGVHAENEREAAEAEQIFKRGRDYGMGRMPVISWAAEVCKITPRLVDLRVNCLRSANSAKSKIYGLEKCFLTAEDAELLLRRLQGELIDLEE
jgi:hypothetical protein